VLDTVISWGGLGDLTQTTSRCVVAGDTCAANSARIEVAKQYDELFRPFEVTTTDKDSNISVIQNSTFNAYNKPTFQSYPYSTNDVDSNHNATTGTTTIYDGLQRSVSVSQWGGSTALTEYLSGHKVKTTDPRGYQTTTTFLAYGQPAQKLAKLIESPESVVTEITYNPFDNITTINQRNSVNYATESHTEFRAYNDYQQLCKTHRSDVGTSVFEYNAAGQMVLQNADVLLQSIVDGKPVTHGSATNCGYKDNNENQPSKASHFTYDNNGEKSQISYDDGTAPVIYTFDENGDLRQLNAGLIQQEYLYNNLRQMTDETTKVFNSAGVEQKSWHFGYTYDNLGNKASTTYPTELIGKVEYAPNAFGQPTQAIGPYGGVYAENARYYAAGSIKTFTYGNGLVHQTTLNDLNLPQNITDGLDGDDAVNLTYSYDYANNITSITDDVDDSFNLTDLTYDGLNRLKTVTGSNSIGSSALTYDTFGNIKTYASKNSSLSYKYDTSGRVETNRPKAAHFKWTVYYR